MIDITTDIFESPRRLYAVRFAEHNRAKGVYLLMARGERGIGLRYGVFIIGENDLRLLERTDLAYETFEVKTRNVEEILGYFGIKSKTDQDQLRLPFGDD